MFVCDVCYFDCGFVAFPTIGYSEDCVAEKIRIFDSDSLSKRINFILLEKQDSIHENNLLVDNGIGN